MVPQSNFQMFVILGHLLALCLSLLQLKFLEVHWALIAMQYEIYALRELQLYSSHFP